MATRIVHIARNSDTCYGIAHKYLRYDDGKPAGRRWPEIVEWNKDNPDLNIPGRPFTKAKPYIYTGVGYIVMSDVDEGGGGTGPTPEPPKQPNYQPTIDFLGPIAGQDNAFYAVYHYDVSNTDHFVVRWSYQTASSSTWFKASETNETPDEDGTIWPITWTAPNNATTIKLEIKPVAKTYESKSTVKGETVTSQIPYWTGKWSTAATFNIADLDPKQLSVPDVSIEGLKITAKYQNLDTTDLRATHVYFEVWNAQNQYVANAYTSITNRDASAIFNVAAGGNYKVKARAYRIAGNGSNIYGAFSDYSTSELITPPAAPSNITELKATSDTSILISWSASATATSYTVEYTDKKIYWNTNPDAIRSIEIQNGTSATITLSDSDLGKEWFFRVKATSSAGDSPYYPSDPNLTPSLVMGKEPAEPTTWSSTTTAITGENLTLYWMHNSQDGSAMTAAILTLDIDGRVETKTITYQQEEGKEDNTGKYVLDTSAYLEGTQIRWQVKTKGVSAKWSPDSIIRVIDVYAKPVLAISLEDTTGDPISIIAGFPFYLKGTPGPRTQVPIGYHVEVKAKESYITTDALGNEKVVSAGDSVYSRYIDTDQFLAIEFSAYNIDLENNIEYEVVATVAMNSGLSSDPMSLSFVVGWQDQSFPPTGSILVNPDSYTASIAPYVRDFDEEIIDGVELGVYRINYDGSYTEIETHIPNGSGNFVTDPHPALDFARYRVVATYLDTGAVTYSDVAHVFGEKAIIIQWDDKWTDFKLEPDEPDEMEVRPWSGSLIRLPYNIDVSDNNSIDVNLVEYIGREHPVSYYGTQVGETSTWNTEIPKYDKETIYQLRRLARYMGNVYVREPSGLGYWAQIAVSFTQTHLELTVPITLSITRVEGGK